MTPNQKRTELLRGLEHQSPTAQVYVQKKCLSLAGINVTTTAPSVVKFAVNELRDLLEEAESRDLQSAEEADAIESETSES